MRILKRYSFNFSFFLTGLLCCLLSAELQPALALEKTPDAFTIIKVKKRPAKELLPQIQTLLSPTGRASVDTLSNAIIVSDTREAVENIQQLTARLDRPVPQVTLRLRYRQAGTKTRSLSTTGGISGGEGGLRMHTDTFHQNKTLQLTLSSGSSGYLMVGRDIPFTDYQLDLCNRYGYRFGWLTQYKRVENGFDVHAVALGSRVDLTLLPRLSFGDSREIRFTRAATRITIPVDTWVPVAASDAGTNPVAAAILTANGQSNSRAMVIEVKARVRN